MCRIVKLENLKGKDDLADLGIDRMTILKSASKKYYVRSL
jgi:hypothetical protein